MNLQPYLPLNTEAKIDALIDDLRIPIREADMNELEVSVLLEIRKLKMQLYFKQHFQQLRVRNNDKRPPVASTVNQQTKVKSLVVNRQNMKPEIITCRLFIGLSIAEVARQLGTSTEKLVHVLQGLGAVSSPNSLFTEELHRISADFIINYLSVKKRQEKLLAIEQKKLQSKADPKAEKFKPSFGKEGNYSKLIYTRPKS